MICFCVLDLVCIKSLFFELYGINLGESFYNMIVLLVGL